MYLTDYHMHSCYSFDGHEKPASLCDMAVMQGMQEIAITDHCDIYTGKPYTYILNCRELYRNLRELIPRYQEQLMVRIGVELGQPQVNPEQAEQFLKDYGSVLDFVIGSVHNMEDDIDVAEYPFKELDCNKVFDHYLDWLMDLASNYDYDVIGHVTYPLRYMAKAGYRIEVKPFEEKVRELYRTVISRGKGIELNTSGLYQEIQETMPSFEMLKWYRDCGGEIITIGSDAHYLKHVGLPIRQGMKLLELAGFRYLTTYEKRKPIMKSLAKQPD